MDGFEFLGWVKRHAGCSVIPTIVFSSSGMPHDVKQAYELGANTYIVKPTNLNELVEIIKKTCEFWEVCQRPPMPEDCS